MSDSNLSQLRLPARKKISGVPVRFRETQLGDYNRSLGDPLAHDTLAAYLNDFPKYRERGSGLLLVGDPGIGKTMMTAALVNGVITQGYWGRFTSMAQLMALRHRSFDADKHYERTQDPDAEAERWGINRLFYRIEGYSLGADQPAFDFVAFDDMGKEHRTDSNYVVDEIDRILRIRYDRGLPIVITSNDHPHTWGEQYSPSMKSFIMEICKVIIVDAPDYRQRIQRGEG